MLREGSAFPPAWPLKIFDRSATPGLLTSPFECAACWPRLKKGRADLQEARHHNLVTSYYRPSTILCDAEKAVSIGFNLAEVPQLLGVWLSQSLANSVRLTLFRQHRASTSLHRRARILCIYRTSLCGKF